MGRAVRVGIQGALGVALAAMGAATLSCGVNQPEPALVVQQQALTAECFQFPTSPYDSTSYYSFGYYPWLNQYCTTPDNVSHPLVHTAQDDKQPVGASVLAAANGTIVAVVSAGTCYAKEMLVKHTLPNGTIVHTQYMHVNPTVTSGDVTKGQTIATVADLNALCPGQGLVPHLHFGVWNSGTITQMSYRGRLPKDVPCGGDTAFADQWINPNTFINSHSTCPTTNATVNVAVSTGAGTVTVTRNGTVIGSTSSSQVFNFNIGDTYAFQASPSSGYTFAKFCGDTACSITTTSNPFSGSITASSGNVFAYFNGTSPTCPSGNDWHLAGQYCWNATGFLYGVVNHNYTCNAAGAAAIDLGACSEGCRNMGVGYNDQCWEKTSTCSAWSSWNTYACGNDSVNGNPIIRYHCYYGSKSGITWCPNRCVIASGADDYCQ
jgi:murein DD-endopeptidase MepM/ murein hydrolase activator NlpD